MKAVVVYQSLWGNTAAIARAIAQGIGPGTPALTTGEASAEALAGAGLIVAGAPLMAFALPTESVLRGIGEHPGRCTRPPDLGHPSMRSWLDALPRGSCRVAAFETRLWWSPGTAAGAILRKLEGAGYRAVARPRRYIVKGQYGPLREGQLERAQAWGAELAHAPP